MAYRFATICAVRLFFAACLFVIFNARMAYGEELAAEGAVVPAKSDELGAAAYAKKCASCHGPEGQGVAGSYEVALAGSRSVNELARLIERTMPEGNPDDCVGEEARAVARYIHDEFYSPAARVRKGWDPVQQVELMRLTVPQYRNAVADVIGFFAPSPAETRRRLTEERERRRREKQTAESSAPASPADPAAEPDIPSPQPGFKATYFSSKGMSKADELAMERVDETLDFDFQAAPPKEGMPADQFAIIWEGALRVDETGEYQMRVTTPNGARLYLNLDPTPGLRKLRDDSSATGQAALIDAWVSSGKLREESAKLFLLGGRRYPIRVEFFKYMEPTASIKVEWKPPRGVWTVLGRSSVTTEEVGRTYVVETTFPADDRSLGYERGKSVSHEWQVATTNAAIAAAEEVVNRLALLAGDQESGKSKDREGDAEKKDVTPEEVAAAAAARQKRLQDFVVRFARVAFRRPLTADEELQLRELPFAGETSPEMAVRRAVVWILSSPEFLYVDLTKPDQLPGPHEMANRLSLALWDSVPDAQLMAAADAGELATAEQVEQHARRMLLDLRARHKLQGFFRHWLELEDRDLSKDRQLFPEFDEQVIADLRRSLELFLDEIVWSTSSDYRQLLSADYLLLNGRLRQLYGVAETVESDADATVSSGGEEFQRTMAPDQQRSGVLTHPYLLSAFAYHNNTSPIHRGVFLTRNIVGRSLKPPPIAVAFKNDEFAADLTMREKITQLTRDSNCQSCHSVINPLGFALEHYDALGRWRTAERNERPVDSKSAYTTENGDTLEVDSARDIAELALSSESAHRAFVVQMFQHLTKQNPPAYGPETTEQLRDQFAADQFHVQNLMVRIAVLAARHPSQMISGDACLPQSTATQTCADPDRSGQATELPGKPDEATTSEPPSAGVSSGNDRSTDSKETES